MPLKRKGAAYPAHRTAPTIDIIPVMTNQKKWYNSTTLRGLAVLLFIWILDKFGFAADQEADSLGAILEAVGELVGMVMVFYGRVKRNPKEIVFKAEVVPALAAALLAVGAVAVLAGCETIEMSATEFRTYAEEASGFDPNAATRWEVGKYQGVALRLFGLPVAPAIVWLGKVEEVTTTAPTEGSK